MIIIAPTQTGFDWVGWLQVVAAFLGVLIASLIAVYVANKQHKMQVQHQMRMDVARFSTCYKRAHDNGSILRNLAELISRGSITDRNGAIRVTKTEIHEAVGGAQEVWRTLQLYAQPKISEKTLAVLTGLESLAAIALQIFDETKNQQFYQDTIPKKYEPQLDELLISTKADLDRLFKLAASKDSERSQLGSPLFLFFARLKKKLNLKFKV